MVFNAKISSDTHQGLGGLLLRARRAHRGGHCPRVLLEVTPMCPWRVDRRGQGRELGGVGSGGSHGERDVGEWAGGVGCAPGPDGPEGMWGWELVGKMSVDWGCSCAGHHRSQRGCPVT